MIYKALQAPNRGVWYKLSPTPENGLLIQYAVREVPKRTGGAGRKIEQLQSAIAAESQSAADAEKWIALMKEYVNPTELTAELLNTLIEKILVHEAVKNEDGSREQEVEIFYRFIDKID